MINTCDDESDSVILVKNLWIPMSDGCQLATTIWLPKTADSTPVPAILEYLPYRKQDGTAERDALTHPYFAQAGFAGVRVDMRGNGDSEGLMEDEYTEQELADAEEVIAWLAEQDWCNGSVGMIGISWGGFNGLQVAFRRPAALKGIISICSTDDRYADDVHYKNGTLLGYNFGWGATMLGYSSRSPDPLIVGDRWREMWLHRLENLPVLAKPWLEHQHRDSYWKHGSVCEDYSAIDVPVFLVGGWADGYSNTIFRMLKNFKTPVKALVGPWAHKYPHFAKPGPAIGFLQECVKFWEHSLLGVDNKCMEEEPIRLYVQESKKPKAQYQFVEGNWGVYQNWPPENVEDITFNLRPEKLVDAKCVCECKADEQVVISSPQTLGSTCGRWFSFGTVPDLPVDQSKDDANSVVFDSAVLENDITIIGATTLNLKLNSDKPLGFIAARLNEIHADGSISQISYGVLNLTHRDSHEFPTPMESGKGYDITFALNEITCNIPKGHKLRLSLSNAYWPMIWPSPENGSLGLFLKDCTLNIPLSVGDIIPAKELGEVESAAPLEQHYIRPSKGVWKVEEDMGSGMLTTYNIDDYGERVICSSGLQTSYKADEKWSILPDDPTSAKAEIKMETVTARAEWRTTTNCRTSMRSDEDNFYITAYVEAKENEEVLFEKSWKYTIARNLV